MVVGRDIKDIMEVVEVEEVEEVVEVEARDLEVSVTTSCR